MGILSSAATASAQVEMPDPSLIHGRALPAPELATGTVTVRVVREAIGNNIAGQQVTVTIGAGTRTATTDDQGRAEFANLPQGQPALAKATVDGEELTSEPFEAPASGGLRVILVAGIKEAAAKREQAAAAAAAAPAIKGQVVISSNSRVMMEFQNDNLEVFYILEVLNNAQAPVDIGGPLLIQLPRGAGGPSIVPGGTDKASIRGETLTVLGPFPPGATLVQAAYEIRFDAPEVTLVQAWPVPVEQLLVAIENVPGVNLTSPQLPTIEERQAENGTLFKVGTSPALAAGSTMTLNLTGLPIHSRVPRWIALGIAFVILVAGGWFAFSGRADAATERRRLIQRRDTLLGELAALEAKQRRKGASLGPLDAARRQRIVTELEQIYGELDESGPQGGGEGIAA